MRSLRALVTKILVSLLAFGLAFTLANFVPSNEATVAWNLGAALFVAGVIFITQFLVDLDRRIDAVDQARHDDSVRAELALRDGFTKINQATELFGLVEASALRSDEVTQMVRYSTTLDGKSPILVREFAQAEIRRVTEVLKVLGQGGDLAYEGQDRDWLLALTANAAKTIDSTSLTTVDAGGSSFVDDGLWQSDLGQRYLEGQLEAIRRGVRIRRLVLVDRPALVSEAGFQSFLDTQRSLGIEVRVLAPAVEQRGRLLTWYSDFIVFDGVLSYEATPATPASLATSRPVIVNTRLVLQPAKVQERMRRFEDLWASGQDPT